MLIWQTKYPLLLTRAQDDIFEFLILSDQHFKRYWKITKQKKTDIIADTFSVRLIDYNFPGKKKCSGELSL